MLDLLIGKTLRRRAQKFIDRLDPDVSAHIPMDLPLPSVWTIKKICVTVSKINTLEDEIAGLSDEQLKEKTGFFKQSYEKHIEKRKAELKQAQDEYKKLNKEDERESFVNRIEELKDALKKEKQKALGVILPEAFAVVRETSKRIISLRHYDTQMVGGMILHEGKIAEMATGEGKRWSLPARHTSML